MSLHNATGPTFHRGYLWKEGQRLRQCHPVLRGGALLQVSFTTIIGEREREREREAIIFFYFVHRFASLLGRILSEMAIDGETRYDISKFNIDRQALTDPNWKAQPFMGTGGKVPSTDSKL